MSLQNLTRFPRLELIGAPTPLEYLPRLSDHLGREIFIKRDDTTPLAMGGNKLRKLEFLAADALRISTSSIALHSLHLIEKIGICSAPPALCSETSSEQSNSGAKSRFSHG